MEHFINLKTFCCVC